MKLIHLVLSCSLAACGADPSNEVTTQETATPAQSRPVPPVLSLPRAENTTALPSGLTIHISSGRVTVDGKPIAATNDLLSMLNPYSTLYSSTMILTPLAEELEIQKQIVLSEQGKEKFDRRVVLYADKDTPARLVWAALYSAVAVGYDSPSLAVTDASGSPAALALTRASKGLLRGVFIEPDGAAPPMLNSDPLALAATLEERSAVTPGYYNSGAEVIPGKIIRKGKLTEDIIRRVVRRSIPGIKFCYEQALQTNQNLVGRLEVDFVIAPNGYVSSSSPQGAGVGAVVNQCVARKISQLTFPAPEGGKEVAVTYPFIFQTPGNEYKETSADSLPTSEPVMREPIVVSFSSEGIKLTMWPSFLEVAKIPLVNSAYDLDALSKELSKQQALNPASTEVILWWKADASYQAMLEVADICIKAKLSAISLPAPSKSSL